MPHISLQNALSILRQYGLLVSNHDNLPTNSIEFDLITYSSSQATPSSLLICKGNFKEKYLEDAISRGLKYYVSDHEFNLTQAETSHGILVTDTRKALAVLAQEFYGHPEKELFTIGITGTKGKSTTAYFTHSILNDYFTHKVALISSVDNCTDGVTYIESDLTTPESLDLYRMLREAADNGLTHAVIEVSSQAYKVDRVFNLRFNVGAFLNIFPDHISPIEHPTFEDYFACKRRIISHSDAMVFGSDILYRASIDADIQKASIPAYFTNAKDVDRTRIDLSMPGEFNYDNAAIAIKIAELAGVPQDSASLEAVNSVRISGRMEVFTGKNDSIVAIVDYAHNGISTTTLLDYVDTTYKDHTPFITLITGSAGNKAINRREEIVQAAQDRIQHFIFTTDDTNTESAEDICAQMDRAVTNPTVQHDIIIDRTQAIKTAIADAYASSDFSVILIIGKGNERWIKNLNKHIPYEGDDAVVQRLLK